MQWPAVSTTVGEIRAPVVLQSPFQSARALADIEKPEGNEYRWIDVAGGAATLALPIQGHWAPRIPVHFVLMRGRVPGTAPQPGNNTDLGKPATMAATAWLDVNPVAHQLRVELGHPESARPGQTIEVTVSLKDSSGKPLRLLKTNPYGVFATYSSLPAGEYALEIKDPKGSYFFDTMKITITTERPAPLEILSKELL
ncbi:MAG: hypothetical protein HGB19_12820 [Chlorobiales bacterium]|nr:hypothetical protein [Chlorobiales bacterium]